MKTLLCLIVCSVFISFSQAQKTLPYSTGFDNVSEQEGWTEFRKGTTTDMFAVWEYTTFGAQSAPNCLSHGYPVGGTLLTDDWFVSPAIDFSNGGIIDSLGYSFSGFGTPFGDDTIALYLLIGHQDPDSSTSRSRLILFTDTSYNNDGIWRNRTQLMIPAVSGDAFIGFRYRTIVNWFETKIDDIKIVEDPSTSIRPRESKLEQQLSIYPNPASDKIRLEIADGNQIEKVILIDNSGKIVGSYSENTECIDLTSYPSAVYFIEVETEQGSVSGSFVKK